MALVISRQSGVTLDPLPSSASHVLGMRGMGRPHFIDPWAAEADRYRASPGDMLSGLGSHGDEWASGGEGGEPDDDDGDFWSDFGLSMGLEAGGRILDWIGLPGSGGGAAEGATDAQRAAAAAARERSRKMVPYYIGGGVVGLVLIVALLRRRRK